MPGMEINLGFGGLSEAVNRLREMERLTASIARNQGAATTAGTAARQAAAGPMARVTAARQSLAEAVAGGQSGAIFDANVRLIRAQQSHERAQRLLNPPQSTMQQRLMTAISTSRFGAGGVMPLVGRTAAVLGGEAAAGPIGLAIAGITAFAGVLRDATQTVGEFRRAATVTGGTAGQTAQLAAMGVAPGQQGQFAADLRERLVTNSRAQAAAQRIGVQLPGHRLAGAVNEAQVAIQVLDKLRAIKDPTRRLLEARELEVEAQLDQILVSDRLWKARKQQAATEGEIMQHNAQLFRDFEGQSSRLVSAWDHLKAVMGGMVAPAAGEVFGGAATGITAASGFYERMRSFTDPISRGYGKLLPDWIENILAPIVPGGLGFSREGGGGGIDANTKALEANTQLIREGVYGGGPRTEGAVPAHLRGAMLADNLKTQKLNLGVFGN